MSDGVVVALAVGLGIMVERGVVIVSQSWLMIGVTSTRVQGSTGVVTI